MSSEHVQRGDPLTKPTKNPKPQKTKTRANQLCSDIPDWLQEFRENLVDDRVPEHRDSHASSSHEQSLEPVRSVELGKHSVYTHFPEDRNCESVRGLKLQGPRAEDALVEPYLVLKILVT